MVSPHHYFLAKEPHHNTALSRHPTWLVASKNAAKTTSFLCALVLSACSGSSDNQSTAGSPTELVTYPSVRFTSCPFDVSKDASLNASEIRCGVLDTYENYENTGADARIIEVAFGIVPATSMPVALDPVVIFIGGPAGSALAGFALYDEFDPFTDNRDVILVDQRGSGFSSPFLHCDGALEPGNLNVERAERCVANFESQGIEISQYRTNVIAQDFKALRKALEIEQWNVYGVSYGPIPGIRYAQLDPEGVRSVIFDSSTDNQVDIAVADVAALLDYITELAIQCAGETECAARLPDLRSIFIDTVRSLENDPWMVSVPGSREYTFTGSNAFFSTIFNDPIHSAGLLDLFSNRRDELMIQLLSNNGGGNDQIDSLEKNRIQRRGFADLMHAAVQCAAIDATNFSTAIIPSREQWPDDLLDMARSDLNYPAVCTSGIISIEQDLSQREPVFLNVPALIMGGALDPVVSLKQVQKFTESFEAPNLAILPKGGHGIGFPEVAGNVCVKGIVASFLQDPLVSPEMDCLNVDIEPFLFGDELVEDINN